MRTTIDGGGRVVIPKAIRARLHLEPGAPVELIERDGWVEVAPAPTSMRVEHDGGAVIAATNSPLPVLTQQTVRDTVEQGRR